MKKYAMIFFLLVFTGCVANFSTKKYVEGNAFVSEGMPAIEIQVSSGFTLADSGAQTRGLEGDSPGATQALGLNVYRAKFYDEGDRSISLIIRTEYTTDRRWYLASSDFNKWPGAKINIGEQIINGRRFDTAIIQELTSRDVNLFKVYSTVYGNQTRLTIFFVKQLRKRMFDSPPYSFEANKILVGFNEMADNSFQIHKFNRPTQSQQISTDKKNISQNSKFVMDNEFSVTEEKIREVKSLYDKGLITQDEYEQKRREIIDEL